MAWFTKPKHDEKRTSLKDDIWTRCKGCNAHVFKEDWHNNMSVCPKCGYHGSLTAYERIGITLDVGTFKEIKSTRTSLPPILFPSLTARGATSTRSLNRPRRAG
jgi:acetyl-CoA carboxylase carboxyl transferase subunit beta